MKGHTRLGWHLVGANRRLNYGDGRRVEVGKTLRVSGKPRLCHHGMHAATSILHCMWELAQKGPNKERRPWLCRVVVGGATTHKDRKFVGSSRRVIWMRRLTDSALRAIARQAGHYVNHVADAMHVFNYVLSSWNRQDEAAFERWAAKHGCPGLKRATKKTKRTK